jgi:hypothetical protein
VKAASESQLAGTVLMVRPVRFEGNPQTAASNRFQGRAAAAGSPQPAALHEFDALVTALGRHGVEAIVLEDTPEPHTPDSIFPNNWVSFHADGRVVLYPMQAVNRRAERRPDVIELLAADHGFQVREVVDLTHHEGDGHFLEGTGSLVLDRVNRIAYACLSSRTHLDPLGEFAQRMGYEVVAFDAVDRGGVPIYHTNVLMNVGAQLAVVCADAIPRDEQREAVLGRLRDTGRDVLTLDYTQLEAFAGNMLELSTRQGRLVAMSRRAYDSLGDDMRRRIGGNGETLVADIATIEDHAGGSVRCMLAEVHLPRGPGADAGDGT